MAVNWPMMVYAPNYDMFARPVTITPLASQPGLPAYNARGIFDTRGIDVQAEDGSIVNEQETILDVLETEFAVVPTQLDRIHIPADADAGGDLGDWEVTSAATNGGGETTLVIRRLLAARPDA
jgi:hypothetical protein